MNVDQNPNALIDWSNAYLQEQNPQKYHKGLLTTVTGFAYECNKKSFSSCVEIFFSCFNKDNSVDSISIKQCFLDVQMATKSVVLLVVTFSTICVTHHIAAIAIRYLFLPVKKESDEKNQPLIKVQSGQNDGEDAHKNESKETNQLLIELPLVEMKSEETSQLLIVLPSEVLGKIINFLDIKALGRMSYTNTTFNKIISSDGDFSNNLWSEQAKKLSLDIPKEFITQSKNCVKLYADLVFPIGHVIRQKPWEERTKKLGKNCGYDIINLNKFCKKDVVEMLKFLPGKITCSMNCGLHQYILWYRAEDNTLVVFDEDDGMFGPNNSVAEMKYYAQMEDPSNKHYEVQKAKKT